MSNLRRQFHEVQGEIQKEVAILKKELEHLLKQDNNNLRVQSILTCHQLALAEVKAFIEGPKPQMQRLFNDEKTTLAQEVELASSETAFAGFPAHSSEYLSCVSTQDVPSEDYRPEDLLLGGQQLNRKLCFILDVLVQKFGEPTEVPDNEVRNAMGGEVNGRPSRERAFLFLVQLCVSKQLELTLDWYINAVGIDFKKYWNLACRVHIHDTATAEFLTKIFEARLLSFLQDARQQLNLNLEPKLTQLRPATLRKGHADHVGFLLEVVFHVVLCEVQPSLGLQVGGGPDEPSAGRKEGGVSAQVVPDPLHGSAERT